MPMVVLFFPKLQTAEVEVWKYGLVLEEGEGRGYVRVGKP